MIRLPPPVCAGDRVGVAALSGPVDPEVLGCGLDALRALGFEPRLAANVRSRDGLFAGSDGERLEAFHRLVADPSLTAIFFARGGHGVLRLLPHIDWPLLKAHPRAYVGYSDLTPLLLEVNRRAGLVAFHGPMVAADLARGLSPPERDSLLAALAGEYPVEMQVRPLRAGSASGVLMGGCLSLLVSTLGTPFCPDFEDRLLFLEDVNEPLFRLDRKLTHLGLSGSLAKVRGMVLGHFSHGQPEATKAAECREWEELARRGTQEFSWPVACDLASGHDTPNLTLPLGLRAQLTNGASRLRVGDQGQG